MYRYKTAEFGLGSWVKKVGKSLGKAYERGVTLSSVKRKIDKQVPGRGYTSTIGNVVRGQFLSTPVLMTRVLKKQVDKYPTNMVDKLVGIGSAVKQGGRNVRKIYIKGVKNREKVKWGNVGTTGAVGVIGGGSYLASKGTEKQKKKKPKFSRDTIRRIEDAYRQRN